MNNDDHFYNNDNFHNYVQCSVLTALCCCWVLLNKFREPPQIQFIACRSQSLLLSSRLPQLLSSSPQCHCVLSQWLYWTQAIIQINLIAPKKKQKKKLFQFFMIMLIKKKKTVEMCVIKAIAHFKSWCIVITVYHSCLTWTTALSCDIIAMHHNLSGAIALMSFHPRQNSEVT